MAYITNQWLSNPIKRSGTFTPIVVKSKMKSEDSDWAKSNSVIASVQFLREDLSYQQVFFTQQDLLDILPALVRISHDVIKQQIAPIAIKKTSDKELLNILKDRLEENLSKSERN